MPPHFIGRDDIIAVLVDRLTSGNEPVVALDGMAGIGKTTLAVALAHAKPVLAHYRDGVLWASLGLQGEAFSALAGWAQALGQDISTLTTLEDRRDAVQRLIGQGRILLVIDDAWNVQTARDLLVTGPGCGVLLTTRDRSLAIHISGREQAKRIIKLEDDSAYQLLQALAPEACVLDAKATRKLSDDLGGLPLALELVGGYLADPEHNAFAELGEASLAEMADPAHRLMLASVRLGARKREVTTLKDTILFSLESLPEEARRTFYALGAFASEPEHFSLEAAKAVTQADARFLALLVARNLLGKKDNSDNELSMHQTLADVARTGMPAEATALHGDYYLGLVADDLKAWRKIEPIYGQIQWCWAQLPEGEDIIYWIYALRIYQTRRGLWRDQIAWIERGLHITEALGLRNDQASFLNNLAFVYNNAGQQNKALELYQQALPIEREVGDQFGEAATLNNMGLVYDNLGQREKALEHYKQSLPITRELGDREGEAATLNNIGQVYNNLGQREKALELYQQALPIQREVGDREGEAATLNNMGQVFNVLGEREKALELYQRALPIMREVGNRDGEATTLNNIGLVYDNLGQREKALELYQQALPIQREVGDHAGEATTLSNMAVVHNNLGQRDMALELYQQALPIRCDVGDWAGESVTRYNLAQVYRMQGRLEEAVNEMRRVVEIDQAISHPDPESHRAMLQQIEDELKNQSG